MNEERKCSSCKRKIGNDPRRAIFHCPNCGKYEIVRCGECRKNAVKYTCPGCGFEGPN